MVQQRELLGRGFKFPFKIGGDSLSHDGPEQSKFIPHVIEGVRHRVLSKRGARRYNRAFGTRLFELSFAILTKSPGLAKRFVQDGLEAESRILLNDVGVRVDRSHNRIYVWADVQFISTLTKANLVFPFYRTEQNRVSISEVLVTITSEV